MSLFIEVADAKPDVEMIMGNNLNIKTGEKYINASKLGLRMKNQLDLLATLFEMQPPEKYGSQKRFVIKGFSDQYAKNVGISVENKKKATEEEVEDLHDLL